MQENPQSVIELSVHGSQNYDQIVLERLMKLEAKRHQEEEDARQRRLEEEAKHPLPELSDEEANEDIRRELAAAR